MNAQLDEFQKAQDKLSKDVFVLIHDQFDSGRETRSKKTISIEMYPTKAKILSMNPNLPIHNNQAERGFTPVARGRHNWLHAYSIEGAEALAVLFFVVQIVQANGVNVIQYTNYYLEKRETVVILPGKWSFQIL